MSAFTDFCARYFRRYFDLHPTEAIYYGVDGYDHLLNDYSDDAYAAEKSFVAESLDALRRIPAEGLDPDEAIDHALLEGRLTIESYERRKEDYRLRQPDIYSPIEAIYILTVRPTRDFPASLRGRLERAPGLIRQGIHNLSRPEANPPKLWTEMAIEGARGALSFLDSLLEHPKVRAEVKNPEELRAAVEKAREAVKDFASFLEADLLPRSSGAYAVGREHYELLLAKKHFLALDSAALLALGEALLIETRKSLAALADELAPGKSIADVTRMIQERHPGPGELLAAYQKAMRAAREFVRENDLVSFPPREELRVVYTPEFRRHEIPFAAYLSPSPRDPEQVGYYYVTPAADEELLREHNWVGLENTSVHESYPGHHLQFSIANSIPTASTLPRLTNESSVFYEGWALYCEQLMQEQGFLGTEEHRFVMLKDRLWRALRIVIDVKTQTGGMTYDEAAELMVRELGFPRPLAHADLNWYSQSPAGPMGYALGWSIINRLRSREQARLGSRFRLRDFHDRLLSAGSISLPLVERRHFQE
ncbi:MAG TPA: DUF885 domain-containing protein [candidate division Zixibacteria bacterium]|nr:DUF885 domain-containing protein [candidate division Zixibacteria bacterium]